jgi:hypothetical protein
MADLAPSGLDLTRDGAPTVVRVGDVLSAASRLFAARRDGRLGPVPDRRRRLHRGDDRRALRPAARRARGRRRR